MLRTKLPGAPALLAALLLIGPGRMLGAQDAPPAARAQEAPSAPAAPPAPSARSVFTGDHTVAQGVTVDDIVVVGGDLRVAGTVTGDAVVVGGQLILEPSGLVEGDATVTGGRILEEGGRIRGEMRVLEAEGDAGIALERAVEGETGGRDAAGAREMSREARGDDDGWRERRSWFGPIRSGFIGLVSAVALGLVLAGIGAVLTFYGRPYLETVSDTVRAATLRSAGVGLAASFLVIPSFVVLVVALAVSIIGIPFLLIAVPLYPLAIAGAAGFGILAAAHAIGERTSEQRNDSFDFRYRNSYAYLFTGLGMLFAPMVAAHLMEMTGFLRFIGILLEVVTWTVMWAATTIGFGAVILSRGGTRRTFIPVPRDPTFEPDPLFDPEPTPGPRV